MSDERVWIVVDSDLVMTIDRASLDALRRHCRPEVEMSAPPPPSAVADGGVDFSPAGLANPHRIGEGEPPHPVAVKAARPSGVAPPVESTPPSRSAPHQGAPHGASTGTPENDARPGAIRGGKSSNAVS